MTVFSTKQFPILFRNRWSTRALAQSIKYIDADELRGEYDELKAKAPSRSDVRKCYFVGHDGRPRAKHPENTSEKHLAIALWRLRRLTTLPGANQLRLLDYQFPLKASRSDRGLGEVDLLGATNSGRLTIVELKVQTATKTRADAPIRALMEGLRYAAVVQANQGAIAREAKERFRIDLSDEPPIVQILAPEGWWEGWCDMPDRTREAAGPWEPEFCKLTTRLQARLGITVECAALLDVGLADVAWDERGPYLAAPPNVAPVNLEPAP